uniref:RecQ-mediated genome instability protein 1 n=1 Tax=Amblyomma maculatum TaxID=34609 RepID=G3MPK1_AMBMU
MNEIDDLADRFAQQHIKVNRSWLQACIRYVEDERSSSTQASAFGGDLYKHLYYQLLLTNLLGGLGMTCLPESAVSAHKLVLKGSFFLQVDSVHDVSQPAYSQLLKITNTENENTGVRADPDEKPFAWQAHPKRMLKLDVTDGTRHMQAIEFEPVPCMSVDMRPGIKILVTGPVECRRGLMFLRADNVRVLGGAVEPLLQDNCQEALLCRVLGRDPSHFADLVVPRRATVPSAGVNEVENRSSSGDQTSGQPERARAGNISSRCGRDFEHDDSRATTIPIANSNSLTVRMSSSAVDVDNAWDRAASTDVDPDDVLMSQIDLEKLRPENEMQDCTDEEVDEDLLREQLDFQAEAANAGALQDITDSNNPITAESRIEPPPSTSTHDSKPNHDCRSEGPLEQTVDEGPVASLPYTRLSSVLKDGKEPDMSQVVIIKGYIAMPTSKLKVGPKEQWQLSAIITDDTASLEVDIDNDLLSNWMGLTPLEAKKKRKLSSKFKEFFAEKVGECQEKMRSLNGLLTVSFPGSKEKLPVLLDYNEWKQD